jgi:hypothetical protein
MQAKCTLTALAGVLLLTGGCMHSPAENSQPSKPAYTEHHSVTDAKHSGPAQPYAPGDHDLVSRMAKDLAQRLGTSSSVFQVLNVQSVVWDDSSLGCPQPGNSYLQAQTPGLRVVFGYQNKPYQYHASQSGSFVYCEHPAVSGLDEK